MKEENYKITVKEIIKITKGKLITGNEEEVLENYCNNSKEVKNGDLYLGIKGEKINGSLFFEEAFEKGAKAVILQEIEITQEQKEKYKNKIDILITVGKESENIAKIAKNHIDNIIMCKTNKEAINMINKIKKVNDYILLKASNGMHFNEILEGIK